MKIAAIKFWAVLGTVLGVVLVIAAPASAEEPRYVFTQNQGHVCLSVPGSTTENNAQLVYDPNCSYRANQRWRQHDVGGGWFELIAEHSGKCMDVRGASRDRVPIIQFQCYGTDNQLWRFNDVGNNRVRLQVKLDNGFVAQTGANGLPYRAIHDPTYWEDFQLASTG
ncbi:RICIN domain-containing protein [Kibdelosporangium philippinense]|uniref:RICIN domain-containing protein n=1 Tax=Kibdelosporangium philippinense TaxID=211113 RepID=A0ABS8ZPI3_9PSEU|nr:RICIN domain-containing protein [Kibdelosporangium philippinense]MCE7009489.1 RICIN domain-containing protein [Kibdelosporangium philippinense]